MESTMMVIRINGKDYNILSEIVKRFFMGTHLVTSMRIMDIEHPHTFALFIQHLSEYEGNEDTIPESWDEVIENRYVIFRDGYTAPSFIQTGNQFINPFWILN